MKDKYYTPTKEEFHIGFEYEYYGDRAPNNSRWHPKVLRDKYIIPQITRVKYLDKDDIESLKFVHIGSLWFENKELDCRIRKWKGTELDIYHSWSKNDDKHTDHCKVFRGSIKNKSELKVLLKQLNIL